MKFDKAILSIAALVAAALPSAVLAADMPSMEPAPLATPMPAYNWSGFYLGGEIGYGSSQTNTGAISFYDAGPTFNSSIPGIGINGNGLLGGIEAGYNWQSGHMLFGFEGDVSAAGIKGSELIVIEDCGHLITMEKPEETNAILQRWLSR